MILSIDIGIRNLALCCVSSTDPHDITTYCVHYWDTINTLESDELQKCPAPRKDGSTCGKSCKYIHENQISCKTHFPKTVQLDPKKHTLKKKLIKDYPLSEIAKVVIIKINEIYINNKVIFDQMTDILIELQPTLNPKMKLISHIIYGKLIELYLNKTINIRFVRASQKLKAYTGPELICSLKGAYAKRKWLGIEYCKWFLENKMSSTEKEKLLPILLNSQKADDLSDCFLMSINAICGVPKKNK